MAGAVSKSAVSFFKGIRAPVAVTVAIVVVVAWTLTWATTDFTMGLMGMRTAEMGSAEVTVLFGLLVVMMVAMMLPAALPMIVAFAGMTRLEAGRPVKPIDLAGTALFLASYILVWGAFAVVVLVGLMAVGLAGPVMGSLALVPAAVLLAAGGYQLTRPKEVCLSQCQSPMSFVTLHWRAGRIGALRMGLRHALYCVGCCWLFMIVLFVAGAMSLVWMGVVSAAIFAEKVGTRPVAVSRAIAAILLVLGGVLLVRGVLGP